MRQSNNTALNYDETNGYYTVMVPLAWRRDEVLDPGWRDTRAELIANAFNMIMEAIDESEVLEDV